VPEKYVDNNPRFQVGTYGEDIFYLGPMLDANGANVPKPSPAAYEKSYSYGAIPSRKPYGATMVGWVPTDIPTTSRIFRGFTYLAAFEIIAQASGFVFIDFPIYMAQQNESSQRDAFYLATRRVDYELSFDNSREIIEKYFPGQLAQIRADLINFVVDGTLPENDQTSEEQSRYNRYIEEYGTNIYKVLSPSKDKKEKAD